MGKKTPNHRRVRSGWRVRGPAPLGCAAALFALLTTPPTRGDIEAVSGVYNAVEVLFDVRFTESSLPQDGWAFQIFFDLDNNLNTGYGAGFERLVRAVEYPAPGSIHFRSTLTGSGPGGWGSSLALLPITWVDNRRVQVLVNLAQAGLASGNIRYTIELYRYGRLIDDVRLARTVQGSQQDCNRNGIPDPTDIANGTSSDCNGNLMPDECDVADGQSDCNGNGKPDTCDIASGFSTDCTNNGIPDECEADCNANGIGDSCDVQSGTSLDCDGNGRPDECEPVAAALGSRWLGIHPPAGPRPVAIRLTGNPQDPRVSCVTRFVQASGILGVSAVYRFPHEWCTAYITGPAIMPNATYTVQLIDGVSFFPPQTVTTYRWADVDGNGFLNVTDVQAIALYINGIRNYTQHAVDIGPCIPDGFVNVTDVQTAVLAFIGIPYESYCPRVCP